MHHSLADLIGQSVTLTLGRGRWKVIFSHLVLLRIEQETGKSTLKGEISPWNLSSRDLQKFLQVTAEIDGKSGIDCRQLGQKNLPHVLRALQDAWGRGMPEREPQEAGNAKWEPCNSWMESWASGKATLGLSVDDWLSFTPRMVQELSRFRLEQVRQQEWIPANIGSWLINCSFARPRDQVYAKDLMLHPYAERPGQFDFGGDSTEAMLRGFLNSKILDESSKAKLKDVLN